MFISTPNLASAENSLATTLASICDDTQVNTAPFNVLVEYRTKSLTWSLLFLQAYSIAFPEWHYTIPPLTMDDNENVRAAASLRTTLMLTMEQTVSHIPQPTRYGFRSPQKPLIEVSSSTSNTRNGAMLPPPTVNGHKRQASNCWVTTWQSLDGSLRLVVPEPDPKRKTLAERAGEPYQQNFAAPRSSTPVSSAVSSAASSRPPSSQYSFSQTYRSNSGASRTTSNSSFSASVGSGLRPPSAQSVSSLARPKTSLAKHKSTNQAAPRPGTALGNRGVPKEDPKPKRMAPSSPECDKETRTLDICPSQ